MIPFSFGVLGYDLSDRVKSSVILISTDPDSTQHAV